MRAVAIDGRVFLDFVAPEDQRQLPAADPRLTEISELLEEIKVGGGAENANLLVVLDNGDGALTGVFADPPLRAAITITDYVKQFLGVIVSMAIDSTITLTVEG